jgi:LCP family protein required for cell wall assembly
VAEAESGDETLHAPTAEEAETRRRRERREKHRQRARRRRRRKRIAVATALAMATLLVLGGVWFWWALGGLERLPDSVGQAGVDGPGTTILLVGSDPGAAAAAGRSGRTGWSDDLVRSDLVMLLHLTRDHRALYVISIPRDSVVQIPGLGPGTLSDAATSGGPRLVARTVEELTGSRLDRLAVLDLDAFREIVDLLDGVVVDVPRSMCDVPAGARRLDGQAALGYIARQPCMPAKDLDRVERQQSLVKAMMRGAVDGGKLTHPLVVNRMLRATAGHLALEHGFSYPSMIGTLWSMRHLRTSNTTFLTVPVAARPLATHDGIDYVLLDEQADQELWAALREDRLAEYLALHSDARVLG